MTKTARVYGGALYDLAQEEQRSDRILEELRALRAAFAQEPAFIRLLATPSISKEERCDILDQSFRGKIDGYLLNFMKILCRKGSIRAFGDCALEFQRRYNEDHGILEVRAVTAVAMDEALRARLQDRLAEITGKRIELSCRVDPGCLGGVRLEMDGKQIDGTVAQRLETLRRQLAQTVL